MKYGLDREFKLAKYAFPIYCLHGPIIVALKHIVTGLPGYIIYPVISISLIVGFCKILQKGAPNIYNIIFGRR